jgi:hypothetical protein
MIVVSEIKDRLSPKKLPPTITAVISGMLVPVLFATPTAIGARAAMVPQLVPMLMDTRHDVMNKPTIIKLLGMTERTKFTTLFTHPISEASDEKAPASMNISSISIIPP